MTDADGAARRTPLSTYRLQLGPDLTFADVAGLIGYLGDLGVSHLYLSPILTARPDSTHGYDVADPSTVSSLLGGEEGLRALAAAAHAAGLGIVIDIVPNHLGTGMATPLWRELLTGGQGGAAGAVFDVDWHTPLPGAAGKVVLPVLKETYGEVLGRGELGIVEEDGEYRVAYDAQRFPLSEESTEAIERLGGPGALEVHHNEQDRWARLHALLDRQHYRLVHWRAGSELINYRRFFTVDDLAGVRVEDPQVFDLTHAKVLELVADGVVDGLRVDHPDGLRDPAAYFTRLAGRTGGVWTVAEKISAPDEPLPAWPIAGTTGYEFCNEVLGLFVDPDAGPVLDAVDAAMGGDPRPYEAQAESAKREMLDTELATDLRRIARLLWVLTAQHLEVRDVSERDCVAALADVLVSFDVYRSYVDPETGEASEEDRRRIRSAIERGAAHGNAAPVLYPFLYRLLAGEAGTDAAHMDVVARVQQLSGALTAKGVEDTLFYRYRRMLAVNEVGGEPSGLGLDVAGFHERMGVRARRLATAMTTTATHDTKRGEDARLRIAALSELPERWADDVQRWHRRYTHLVSPTDGGPAPDPQTELVLYQTLVAVWPAEGGQLEAVRARVVRYLVKAGREAKQHTSWRDPHAEFEAGVERYLTGVLDDPRGREELGALAAACAEIAVVSGLSQVLLRCLAPGVPDTYQGTETWETSLVDPDNRRPVDFAARRRMLAELDAGESPGPAALLAAPRDGRVKAWVLSRALRARRDHPEAVGPGSGYRPLGVTGALARHVVAFARTGRGGDAELVVLAPRLPGRVMRHGDGTCLGKVWAGTEVTLPGPGPWTDLLSGNRHESARLPVDDAFAVLPVALLVS